MNTDIRVAVSFLRHRKRLKLRVLLGPGSTDYLLNLWINTAMNHPSGDLAGMSNLDVALEAGWEDDPDKFINALKESVFLDGEEGAYKLHDWAEHQPWVVGAKARSDHGKKAVTARWEKQKGPMGTPAENTENTPSMPGVIPLSSPFLSLPTEPSKEKTKTPYSPPPGGERAEVVAESEPTPPMPPETPKPPVKTDPSEGFEEFWAAYPRKTARKPALKAWEKSAATRPPLAEIIEAIRYQRTGRQWQEGFIPHPATWLNGERWADVTDADTDDEPEDTRPYTKAPVDTPEQAAMYAEGRRILIEGLKALTEGPQPATGWPQLDHDRKRNPLRFV